MTTSCEPDVARAEADEQSESPHLDDSTSFNHPDTRFGKTDEGVDDRVGHLHEEAVRRKERLRALRLSAMPLRNSDNQCSSLPEDVEVHPAVLSLDGRFTSSLELFSAAAAFSGRQRHQRYVVKPKDMDSRQEASDMDENNGEEVELDTESAEATFLPKPIFRNYKPCADGLKAGELPPVEPVNLTPRVAEQLEAAKQQTLVDEVNLASLAPRKPDWDLKRGVEKKLRKLERRTQRAIAELIRTSS